MTHNAITIHRTKITNLHGLNSFYPKKSDNCRDFTVGGRTDYIGHLDHYSRAHRMTLTAQLLDVHWTPQHCVARSALLSLTVILHYSKAAYFPNHTRISQTDVIYNFLQNENVDIMTYCTFIRDLEKRLYNNRKGLTVEIVKRSVLALFGKIYFCGRQPSFSRKNNSPKWQGKALNPEDRYQELYCSSIDNLTAWHLKG